MSEEHEVGSADSVTTQPAFAALPPLVEPTEWLTWDELDGPEEPVALVDEENTAPARPTALAAPVSAAAGAANGVHALRALLLGSEPPDYGARLDAIERRLAEIGAHPSGGAADAPEARLRAVEQRLERLAESVEQARDATRGADVTLESLAALQQRLDDLRRDQAHLLAEIAERAREADERCRLRQRQVRTARRAEAQWLRRRLYAKEAALAQTRVPADAGAHPRATATLATTSAGAGRWEMVESSAPADDEPAVFHTADDALDARDAWRAVWQSLAALLRALWAWIVIVAHLAADDMRAAAQQIANLFR
jgi:hypothetical protein